MATDKQINIIIDAQNRTAGAISSAQKNIDSFKSSVEKMQPTFKKMATIGTLAFAGIAAGIKSSMSAFADSEAKLAIADTNLKNLSNTALKTFGGSIIDAQNKIREFGDAMQKLGGEDSEQVSISLTRMAQKTGDFKLAQQAVKAALDLSIAKQMDFESASNLVEKALGGNTAMLGRYGIEIKDGADATEIFGSIAEVAGGQYASFGETVAGKSKIMMASLGDVNEAIGKAMKPAFDELLKILQPVIEKFAKFVEDHPKIVAAVFAITLGILGLTAIIGFFGIALGGLGAISAAVGIAMFPLSLIILGITVGLTLLVAAILWVATHWELFKEKVVAVWEFIKPYLEGAIQFLLGPLGILLNFVKLIIKNWETLKTFFVDLWENLKGTFKSAVDSLKSILQPVLDMINNIINKIQSIGGSIKGGAKKAVGKVGDLLGFDTGGVVPGPIGAPQLAMVHGGETILPTHKSGGGGFGGMVSITINNPMLLDQFMVQKMSKELANLLKNDLRI